MGRANGCWRNGPTRWLRPFPICRVCRPRHRPKLTITGNPVRDMVLKQKAAPYPAVAQLQSAGVRRQPGRAVFRRIHAEGVCRDDGCRAPGASGSPSRCGRRTWMPCQRPVCGLSASNANSSRSSWTCRRASPPSHLVVCRSGASTIAELGVIGTARRHGAAAACASTTTSCAMPRASPRQGLAGFIHRLARTPGLCRISDNTSRFTATTSTGGRRCAGPRTGPMRRSGSPISPKRLAGKKTT